MKIAVINFSGNVGKSTVARHLLAPRLKNAPVIPIETINADDGLTDEAMKGKQYGQLLEALAVTDNAVVDIGASNVEDVITLMGQYKGSHEDFDCFVVPTAPVAKQMRDTITTIEALSAIGVESSRIRVLFNMVDLGDAPASLFASLFSYHADRKNFKLSPGAVVHTNELYGKLQGRSIQEVLDDPTDYKQLIKDSTDPGEKMKYSQALGVKRLAAGVLDELDAAFKALLD
ncbi:hypothetical protein OOT46_25920 [Aquabacterium sp. A7-Y]|uniref:StbB family protein n=1 Tax=Aquabacterium sp. A7-Y TaxID=1349605 RepID=UPI00223D937D|nr:StbB family protein [Aquabacterium sp. A7-Y]MCW7541253.1 hypothetical protein [Aquabacterium sp. A7-Y]